MKRLSVLLIAEAANPEWTSVPLEGWSHVDALRAFSHAHLATLIRDAEGLRHAGFHNRTESASLLLSLTYQKPTAFPWRSNLLARKQTTTSNTVAADTSGHFHIRLPNGRSLSRRMRRNTILIGISHRPRR